MSDTRPQSSTSIVERLRFDAVRCELHFSKGVASNIEEGIAEIERLRAVLVRAQNYLRDEMEFAARGTISAAIDASAKSVQNDKKAE